MVAFSRFFPAMVICLAVWTICTWSGLPLNGQEMAAGLAVSFLAAFVVSSTLFEKSGAGLFSPIRWLRFLAYIPIFIREEIKSHVAVIKLIISGKTNPAIVRAPVRPKTAFGRMMLANSITLTPGTFVLHEGRDFYIHCLDYSPGPDIVAPFDKRVEAITE